MGDWRAFSGGVLGLHWQLLGLRAEGNWRLTERQILFRVGVAVSAGTPECRETSFLGPACAQRAGSGLGSGFLES